MRIAVLILCHNNPDKVNRLISALCDQDIDTFVHIDKKSDIKKDAIINSGNVKLLPDEYRINVKWAQFSQIEAEINLLKYATNIDDYGYYVLLSGSDYPIVPISVLKDYLLTNNGSNFVNLYNSLNYNNDGKANHYDKCNDIAYSDWLLTRYGFSRVIRRLWVAITGGYNHTFSIFKRKLDSKIKFYFGSQWWALSKDFVNWALDQSRLNSRYVSFYRKCSTPDESFFQTLMMNSKFSNTRKDYLHYIDWTKNDNSPKELLAEDYDKIIGSGKFFARKINDESLMNMIDKHISDYNVNEV